jgi:hypothetical protein
MIYPIAVIVIATVVVAAILWKVIPTFAQLFAGLGAQLPLPTRVVIAMSNGLLAYGPLIIIALGLIGYRLQRYYATVGGRYVIDALVLKMPILGMIMRKIAVARFCRTLSTLLSSGVPILDGSTSRRGPPATRSSRKRSRRRAPASSAAKPCRAPARDQRVPVDGRPDDQRRRDDRRARRDAREDRRLLRREGRHRGGRPADPDGADHDRGPRRRRRRHRHRDVHADLRPDQQDDLSRMTTPAALRRKLLWLIGGRAGVITLLLGSAILIQLKSPGSFPIDPFFALIGLTYALTVVWTLTLPFVDRHPWLVDVPGRVRRGDRVGDRPSDRRRHELLRVALHAADHRGRAPCSRGAAA